MPPSSVHFNGSVNLPDAETVMREISSRIPSGVRRMTDDLQRGLRRLAPRGDNAKPNPTTADQEERLRSLGYAAGSGGAGPLDDPQDRARGDALAAAALTDDADRLGARDVTAGAVDRFDDAFVWVEVRFEVADRDQRHVSHGSPFGRCWVIGDG